MHSKPEHKPFVEPVQKSDEDDLYVDALVAAAPPLTDQQRTALAELLRPVRISGAS